MGAALLAVLASVAVVPAAHADFILQFSELETTDNGKLIGEPFRVTEFESPGRMVSPRLAFMDIALAADRLVLPIMEVSGSIWVLENVDR